MKITKTENHFKWQMDGLSLGHEISVCGKALQLLLRFESQAVVMASVDGCSLPHPCLLLTTAPTILSSEAYTGTFLHLIPLDSNSICSIVSEASAISF